MEPQHEIPREDGPRSALIAQVKEYLAQIKQNLLFPKVILRFHALRRLTATMTADIVPFAETFALEIHKRCQEAHLTYIAMERLSFNAVWHLVGATVCPSKLGIGPLERSCQEDLSNLTDRQVTSLVLGNSSHFCYGNSLIHAYLVYLWTCATGCHASLPA